MGDFAESTMWLISALERASADASGMAASTVSSALMPSTMLSDLRRLQVDPTDTDPLAVVATCVRHRTSVLLNFEHGPWLWAVTLMPDQRLYHSPHDVNEVATLAALSKVKLISAEPPKVRPPAFGTDAAALAKYRPLASLLGALALYGPRATLLADIGGRAAYRLTPGGADTLPDAPGALAPAVQRLRREAASLRCAGAGGAAAAARGGVAARHRALARHEPRTCLPPDQRAVPRRRPDGHARPPRGPRRALDLAQPDQPPPLRPVARGPKARLRPCRTWR
jgi:hypothetical protein